MKRPAGVIASAIVVFLGSTFALLVPAAGVAALFIAPSSARPPGAVVPTAIAGFLMMAASGVLGSCTGVGLSRLRPWARVSILIFAGFLALGCFFVLLTLTSIPFPPDTSAATASTIRRVTAAVFGGLLAIAAWWLIQFNTLSTKAAFASSSDFPSPRPISITVIAWASITGGATTLLAILVGSPAFLFGFVLHDWAAGVLYAVFAALSLFIGKGLLDLREEARILGIGWYGFSLLQTAVVGFVPSLRQRMFDMQKSISPQDAQTNLGDLGALPNVWFGFGMILAAAAIFFLVRERHSFGD